MTLYFDACRVTGTVVLSDQDKGGTRLTVPHLEVSRTVPLSTRSCGVASSPSTVVRHLLGRRRRSHSSVPDHPGPRPGTGSSVSFHRVPPGTPLRLGPPSRLGRWSPDTSPYRTHPRPVLEHLTQSLRSESLRTASGVRRTARLWCRATRVSGRAASTKTSSARLLPDQPTNGQFEFRCLR